MTLLGDSGPTRNSGASMVALNSDADSMAQPTIIEYAGGRLVRSYSVFDKGYDPFSYFPEERNTMRLILGDIQFVARYSEDAILLDLLLVPEYPSGFFHSFRNVMTFYGIVLNRAVMKPIIEIRAWESVYKRLSWDDGISLLTNVDAHQLTELQRTMLRHIDKLDRHCHEKMPNYSKDEMRSIVGAPIGARISIMPLAFGLA